MVLLVICFRLGFSYWCDFLLNCWAFVGFNIIFEVVFLP